MSNETWHLIEVLPRSSKEVDELLGGARPRLLVVRHYFPGDRNHRLIACGGRDACFAALRLMREEKV